MRVVSGIMDAYEGRRREIVVVLPKVWPWTWRVGVTMVLMAIASATMPGVAATGARFYSIGVALMLLGLFGAYAISMANAVLALAVGASGDTEGSP